jgi:hypothetical protein
MNAYVKIISGGRVKITVKRNGKRYSAVRQLHYSTKNATATLKLAA